MESQKAQRLITGVHAHLKMQSLYGLIETAKARYPEIVAFQNADELPGRKKTR